MSFLHRALCGPSMHLQPVCLYFIYIPMQVLLTTTLHVFITDQTHPVTMQLSMILVMYRLSPNMGIAALEVLYLIRNYEPTVVNSTIAPE